MKLGLRGQVRRVWAPRGVAVTQAVPIGWKYTYVAVALDPLTGRLWWAWQKNMKGEEMARIWGVWAEEPAIDGWVWDGAGGHTGKAMQALDAPRVVQPPYAPELNPVERFFRESRRAVEGRRLSGPAGQAGGPGAHPASLAGGPEASEETVRLGLDPQGPDQPARDT